MKLIDLAKILIASSIAFSVAVGAHNKVVVIPLGDAEAASLKNIITVSAENGDFTNVADAMASITDADFENPYVIFIGPGRYELADTLEVKNHVHIRGSGKNITALRGDVTGSVADQTSALVSISGFSTIANLALSNAESVIASKLGTASANNFRTAIYAASTSIVTIDNVHVNVSDFATATVYGVLSDSQDIGVFNTTVVASTQGEVASSRAVFVRNGTMAINEVSISTINGETALADSPNGHFYSTSLKMSSSAGDALLIDNDQSRIIQSTIFSGSVEDRSGLTNCVNLIDNTPALISC